MSRAPIDTIVIGGGLHGLSAALHLARAGHRVTVLEKSWVGRHASGGTAAGVRTLNRHLAEIPISLESMVMWHHIKSLVGNDCGFHAHGQFNVAEKPEHMAVLERRLALTHGAGYRHEELIDREELIRLVPAIAPHCLGALISRQDGAADPHRTLQAFRISAEAAGVSILEGTGVTAIERFGSDWRVVAGTETFVAPTVVNAAGAWAGNIASMVGDNIPLGHKASMMIVTERAGPVLKPVISVVGRPLSLKQSDQGTLVIGGGLQGSADVAAQQSFVHFDELSKGARAAIDLFPLIRALRIVRTWTGIEAKTDDYLPVIGPSANASGVYHAFGFSGHGFQLVPVVGAILAELIVDGHTTRPIGSFAIQRFMAQPVAA